MVHLDLDHVLWANTEHVLNVTCACIPCTEWMPYSHHNKFLWAATGSKFRQAFRVLYRIFSYGNLHVVAAIVSVCKHALYRGVWGHAPPPGKFYNLQPLRRFLVAPVTTYTVWFVRACSKMIINAIEGPEFESVNFEEILDILRSVTGVFCFKNPTL